MSYHSPTHSVRAFITPFFTWRVYLTFFMSPCGCHHSEPSHGGRDLNVCPRSQVPAQKAMGCVWKMVAERAQLVDEEGAAPDFNQSDLELHFARKPASYIMKRHAPGVARSLR